MARGPDHGPWEASWSFLGLGRGTSKCPRDCLTLHERDHESWSNSWLVKGSYCPRNHGHHYGPWYT
ncbi:hypothetical protein H5410_061944 [Solanum commersonii]|uniref:Uncharacterized protein n=1 Tax=Solanum commersonii TaxID=4109 RepID=A0A9J5W9F0_SOLCO|nr:hypothetical protein H5410_061944 [Solanum commersonii]